MRLHTLVRAGSPAGFFMLKTAAALPDRRAMPRSRGATEILYFGLTPEAHGCGLGGRLLRTAVHAAWDAPGTRRVVLNTNTLDHPNALPLCHKVGRTLTLTLTITLTLTLTLTLPLYHKVGFETLRVEMERRAVDAPRDEETFSAADAGASADATTQARASSAKPATSSNNENGVLRTSRRRSSPPPPPPPQTDENGDAFWPLSDKRRVTVGKFGTTTLISIREYYSKGGKELPTPKGISLTVPQCQSLMALGPVVDSAIAAIGKHN